MTPPQERRKRAPKAPVEERRGPENTKSLRWVKGALQRPLGFERRGSQLHVVLVDRRRSQTDERPVDVSQIRSELRTRLLEHQNSETAQVMRHLAFVHDRLGRKGWAGVELLAPQILVKALVQAEMLATEDTTPAMTALVERLRVLSVAATVREERKARLEHQEQAETIEISEGSQEEFEELERGWVDTVQPS